MKRQYQYLNTDGPGRALFDPGLGDKTRRRRRCVDDATYAEKSATNSAMKYAWGERAEVRGEKKETARCSRGFIRIVGRMDETRRHWGLECRSRPRGWMGKGCLETRKRRVVVDVWRRRSGREGILTVFHAAWIVRWPREPVTLDYNLLTVRGEIWCNRLSVISRFERDFVEERRRNLRSSFVRSTSRCIRLINISLFMGREKVS